MINCCKLFLFNKLAYHPSRVMKRAIFRLLRLRNLVMLTIIVILLYLIKVMQQTQVTNEGLVMDSWKGVIQAAPKSFEPQNDYFVPTSLKKIDWHDYAKINEDNNRQGIGEHGLPATLPKKDQHLEDKLYKENGFNGALSDRIPLNRSLPDIRHKGCQKKLYIESLPTVSVVVPFHNEHWSTLLRTAYSVLHRSPEHLIKEVFLVDDASTKDFLKKRLEDFLAEHMPKVKVLRLPLRRGLITARLEGAKHATGDVLIFLDSHTEANVNWLPPLLEPIALDYRTVVCPFIDVIAYDTFEYRAQDEGARGAFDWEFFYKRLPVLPQDVMNMPEPFASPVMAGGLFAISRAFFWQLGGYDPGLDIWGGEQYELSFKIWQCGGRMLDAPCSRVGHIYRKFAPFPNPGHGDFVGRNYRRVAEVWMDDYAHYLYIRRPHYRDIETGDISEQKALRERLNCKPFKWFMTQVAFDLVGRYPPVEPGPFAYGKVRAALHKNLCIDAVNDKVMADIELRPCDQTSGSQDWVFTYHKDVKMKSGNKCWDLPESSAFSPIKLYPCHLGGGNQLWKYDINTKQLRQGHGTTCVEYDPATTNMFANRCSFSDHQKWLVDYVDNEKMSTWEKKQTVITGPVETEM